MKKLKIKIEHMNELMKKLGTDKLAELLPHLDEYGYDWRYMEKASAAGFNEGMKAFQRKNFSPAAWLDENKRIEEDDKQRRKKQEDAVGFNAESKQRSDEYNAKFEANLADKIAREEWAKDPKNRDEL